MTVEERETLGQIESTILATVAASDGPYPPKQLLSTLLAKGFSEDLVRAAIWFLVDANKLDFDRQRRLVPVVQSPMNG
jgi:hypothetical protein